MHTPRTASDHPTSGTHPSDGSRLIQPRSSASARSRRQPDPLVQLIVELLHDGRGRARR
jgi:hypothetical protein